MDKVALDDIIRRLLDVKGKPGKQVQLSESEIRQLCMQAREIFLKQPNLLDLEAPIKICGRISVTLIFQLFFSIRLFSLINWIIEDEIIGHGVSWFSRTVMFLFLFCFSWSVDLRWAIWIRVYVYFENVPSMWIKLRVVWISWKLVCCRYRRRRLFFDLFWPILLKMLNFRVYGLFG